jgi:vacuolar-type H+-ATPase subunit H
MAAQISTSLRSMAIMATVTRWRGEMSTVAIFFRCTLPLLAALALIACEKEGPAERAGKQIDEAMTEAQEGLEAAAEEAADAAEELGDAAREGAAEMRKELPGELRKEAREMKKGMREACEDMKSETGARDTDC